MKSDKLYRFGLSWKMDTDEKILAGEFLESLGYKKSAFIIQLVSDYISKNPGVMDKDKTIKVVINSNSKSLESIIKDMVKAEISDGKYVVPSPKWETDVIADAHSETKNRSDGVAAMLDNLSAWD